MNNIADLFAIHDKYYHQGINTCEGCLHYGAATCYDRNEWFNECQNTLKRNLNELKIKR